MRRLIINADDFGLSPGVSRGILRAWLSRRRVATRLSQSFPVQAAPPAP